MADKEFLFSIVMSVYNVEPYIEKAVKSVLNQTIGFEENIQLVLVNDGSTDNSGDICKFYQSEYPSNVVYVEQENAGLPAARNAGLKYVTGKYVNFFDPDDKLSKNALKRVATFFGKHELEIDFVAIPLVNFEGQKGLHGKYKTLGKKNRVINLLKEPHNFVLSSAAAFYKREVFDDSSFDESLSIGEDADFNFRLFAKNPRYGYVCENKVVYHYRRRKARGSKVDALREGSCKAALDNVALLNKLQPAGGAFLDYQKEFIAYQLRSVLRDVAESSFPTRADYELFLADCRKLVDSFDPDFILRRSKIIDSNARRELFLRLKGSSMRECLHAGAMGMNDFAITCRDIAISQDQFNLDITYECFNCPVDVIAINASGEIFEPQKSSDFNAPFDAKYGEFLLDNTHYRKFVLPYKVGNYSFYFRNSETGLVEASSRLRATGKPPLMSLGPALGVSRFGKKAFIRENSIKVVKDPGSAFSRGRKTAKSIKRNSHIDAKLRALSRDKKKYVIVMDRPNKAGDNGQALYEHIMKYGSEELKRYTYFVLDENAGDYASLPNKSHVLQPRSLKHKLIFLNARMVYSSHNARQFYIPFAQYGKYYADLFDYTFVWLQHGIAQNDYTRQSNRLRTEDDYIVTSTPKEREMLLSPAYFYEPDQILLTGLSRYDKLSSDPKRIITIAPTWRSSLCGKILSNGFHQPVPGFEDSEYYRVFTELLTSERFKAMLKKHDFKCQFLCHMGFACYEKWFEKLASDRVEILHQADANYSQIFKESSIFVTDFSSTAFDFAYLNKPLIYFQFDELTQYDPGWFSYKDNGLGPITKTVDETLDKIEHYLDNDCAVDEFYAERIDSFFAYHDRDNCKRLLDATLPEDLK